MATEEQDADEVELVFVKNLETKDKFDEKIVLVEDAKQGVMEITGFEQKSGDYVFKCRMSKSDFENRFVPMDPGNMIGQEMGILPNFWMEILRGENVMGKSHTKRKHSSTSSDKSTNVKKKSPSKGKIDLEEFKELGDKEK